MNAFEAKDIDRTDPNIATMLYKLENSLLEYLKQNLPECKINRENWPGNATIMIRHDAFISPVMIKQKVDTIYEIVYKAYMYGHGFDKESVPHFKPSRFVMNIIGSSPDLVYYSYSDKNIMKNAENDKLLGREWGNKIIPILKEKEYIKEVTNFDTILPFVNDYIQNMKKALREAQIKSIS